VLFRVPFSYPWTRVRKTAPWAWRLLVIFAALSPAVGSPKVEVIVVPFRPHGLAALLVPGVPTS